MNDCGAPPWGQGLITKQWQQCQKWCSSKNVNIWQIEWMATNCYYSMYAQNHKRLVFKCITDFINISSIITNKTWAFALGLIQWELGVVIPRWVEQRMMKAAFCLMLQVPTVIYSYSIWCLSWSIVLETVAILFWHAVCNMTWVLLSETERRK